MFNVIRGIASIIVIALAGYSLVTQNFKYNFLMMFFLGVTLLMVGLLELKKGTKSIWGYLNIAVSFFVFYVAIKGFLQLL